MISNKSIQQNAFLLNINAKNVTRQTIEKLKKLIPVNDLFYSKSLDDSENIYNTITSKGYQTIFNGGGDGTIVNAINILHKISKRERKKQLPKIGILKLGTGNAMAKIANAKHVLLDIHNIINGQNTEEYSIKLIECDNEKLAPFAGIGYDSEILNDYIIVKNRYKLKSIPAYFCAAFFRTLPKQIFGSNPIVRIYTNSTAYKIFHKNGHDQQVKIPYNTLLYEGPSSLISIGSMPWYGFGLEMFPFAYHKEDFLNLRINNMRISTIVTNLYPQIWNGTHRHPKLQDFLVKDITINCSKPVPYQIGGDFLGYREKLRFKIAEHCVKMVKIVQ